MVAALFLGACGLPLGVQIASLVADGISFVATEKTLGDHGLSMVTNRDCAVWRGFKGEAICRPEEPQVIIVQSDVGAAQPTPDAAPPPPLDPQMMLSNTQLADTQLADTQLAEMDVAAGGGRRAGAAPAADQPPGESPVTELNPSSETPATELNPSSEAPPGETPATEPNPSSPLAQSSPPASAEGGTFFVIASYRQVRYARRMVHGKAGLGARILAGTAKGRSVYRVAVGPVSKAQRRRVRQRLIEAGFTDTWKLALKKPKIIVEVATLR